LYLSSLYFFPQVLFLEIAFAIELLLRQRPLSPDGCLTALVAGFGGASSDLSALLLQERMQ